MPMNWRTKARTHARLIGRILSTSPWRKLADRIGDRPLIRVIRDKIDSRNNPPIFTHAITAEVVFPYSAAGGSRASHAFRPVRTGKIHWPPPSRSEHTWSQTYQAFRTGIRSWRSFTAASNAAIGNPGRRPEPPPGPAGRRAARRRPAHLDRAPNPVLNPVPDQDPALAGHAGVRPGFPQPRTVNSPPLWHLEST